MGKSLEMIIDGLTYAGDIPYILVNYTLLILTLLPFTGIIYYAVTLEPEAIVGHTVAVLLGSLLFYLYRWILKEN